MVLSTILVMLSLVLQATEHELHTLDVRGLSMHYFVANLEDTTKEYLIACAGRLRLRVILTAGPIRSVLGARRSLAQKNAAWSS